MTTARFVALPTLSVGDDNSWLGADRVAPEGGTNDVRELAAAAALVASGYSSRITLVGIRLAAIAQATQLADEWDVGIETIAVRPGGRLDLVVSPRRPNAGVG